MRKMQAGSMEFVVADCYLLAHKVAQSLFINAQYFGRVAIPGAHQTIPDQRGFRKERELPIAHAKCAWAGETQCIVRCAGIAASVCQEVCPAQPVGSVSAEEYTRAS